VSTDDTSWLPNPYSRHLNEKKQRATRSNKEQRGANSLNQPIISMQHNYLDTDHFVPWNNRTYLYPRLWLYLALLTTLLLSAASVAPQSARVPRYRVLQARTALDLYLGWHSVLSSHSVNSIGTYRLLLISSTDLFGSQWTQSHMCSIKPSKTWLPYILMSPCRWVILHVKILNSLQLHVQ